MKLFIARFESGGDYWCDAQTLGVFSTEEKAEEVIKDNIRWDKASHPNYPSRYEQRRDYYSITEAELDERL